jgi:hypothetical protein
MTLCPIDVIPTLTRFAVEIKNTTGATRDAYRKVQEETSALEPTTIELRVNKKAGTRDGHGEFLRTFEGHIYSDAAGKFPAKLGSQWEEDVVTTEIARPSFIAWYRNRDTYANYQRFFGRAIKRKSNFFVRVFLPVQSQRLLSRAKLPESRHGLDAERPDG